VKLLELSYHMERKISDGDYGNVAASFTAVGIPDDGQTTEEAAAELRTLVWNAVKAGIAVQAETLPSYKKRQVLAALGIEEEVKPMSQTAPTHGDDIPFDDGDEGEMYGGGSDDDDDELDEEEDFDDDEDIDDDEDFDEALYERRLAEAEQASLADPDGLGSIDIDDYRAAVGLPPVESDEQSAS
jgi:hypothetical protein